MNFFKGGASTIDIGMEFRNCVKRLMNRQKLKKFFTERDIVRENQCRRQSFSTMRIDMIIQRSRSESIESEAMIDPNIEFQKKIRALKCKSKQLFASRDVDFETFSNIMTESGLGQLGCYELFSLFDTNGDKALQLDEFIFTLISFDASDEDDAAKLYFRFCDTDENGTITREELQEMVEFATGQSGEVALATTNHLYEFCELEMEAEIDLKTFTAMYYAILNGESTIF
jgi:Ca2+-binding EF-hand superfamily protein